MSQQPEQSNEFVEWVQMSLAAHGDGREGEALERAVSSYLSGPGIDEIRSDPTLKVAGDDVFTDMLVAERAQRERNVVDIVTSTDIEYDESLDRHLVGELSDPDIQREFAESVGIEVPTKIIEEPVATRTIEVDGEEYEMPVWDESAQAAWEAEQDAEQVAKDAEYNEQVRQMDQWVRDYEGELDQFATDTLSPHNISPLASQELGLTLYDAMMDNRRAVSTGTQVPFEQVAQGVFTTYLDATPTIDELNVSMDPIYGTDEHREAMKQRITREAEVIVAMSVKSPSYPGADVPYSPTLDAEISDRITHSVNRERYAARMAPQREAYLESIRGPQAPSAMERLEAHVEQAASTSNARLAPSDESTLANEKLREMVRETSVQTDDQRQNSFDGMIDAMRTIVDEPVEGATRGWRIESSTFDALDAEMSKTQSPFHTVDVVNLQRAQQFKDLEVARTFDRVVPVESFDESPYRSESVQKLMKDANHEMNQQLEVDEVARHPDHRNMVMNGFLAGELRILEEEYDSTSPKTYTKTLSDLSEVMRSIASSSQMAIAPSVATTFDEMAHDSINVDDGLFDEATSQISRLSRVQNTRSQIDFTIPDETIIANRRKADAPTKQREVEREAEVEVQHESTDDYEF